MNEETVKAILDEENFDNVTVYTDKGSVVCEQVALIPYADSFYSILCPAGDSENEVVIYAIDEQNKSLTEVTDETLCEKLFDIYCEMLEDGE